MFYFISDLHLGDDRLLKYRPHFSSTTEMNETLIRMINYKIDTNDTLFILGDISEKTGLSEANELIRRINGHKVLIRGNHDLDYDARLFDEISDYMEFSYNSQTYVLCHYPFMAWKQMKEGSVNLHGHLHSSREYNENNHAAGRLQYDVGVDANSYIPVSIREIELWCKTSPWEAYEGRDHHACKTKTIV